jgi:hypothetical protein
MHNVEYTIAGDKLTITVDVSKKALAAAPPSSSGKTKLVATTGGALPIAVPGAAVTFAINVMSK